MDSYSSLKYWGRAVRKLGVGLVIWLMVELWLLVQLGQFIGGLGVLAVTIASVLTGRYLLKGQGAAIVRALRNTQDQSLMSSPGAGASRILAGVLLIMPGLLSDVIALLCMLPLTRAWLLRVVVGRLRARNPYAAKPSSRVIEGELLPDEPPAAIPYKSTK